MSYIYRIYTEKTEALPAQIEAVSKEFESFTLIESQGYWKGQPESSVIFEIICPEAEGLDILTLAQEIKRLGGQEAVLCTEQTLDSVLV